jgi:ribosomal protein L11 methyltransferase
LSRIIGPMHLELSFELPSRDAAAAEAAALACGACAVTFLDAGDDPVLEPAAGELRLWPATAVRCLFEEPVDLTLLRQALAAALGIDPSRIGVQELLERAWEREWQKDSHALRFGQRLWVCPQHETVKDPDAVVVSLDPGLAFGTGSHPSTALCLTWLDAQLPSRARLIDYGCGSGVLAIAAARLGASEVHAFDIDPQALTATRENACANGVPVVHVHEAAATLPEGVDVLLANILCRSLCELAMPFAALVRAGGVIVLSGLMTHEVADVTAAYGACFDVTAFGARNDWVCLAGRRR